METRNVSPEDVKLETRNVSSEDLKFKKKLVETVKEIRGDIVSRHSSPIAYPRNIEVTVESGEMKSFHPSVSSLTDSEKRLFTFGSDSIIINGLLGRESYRKTSDTAYLAKNGRHNRTLGYTVEEKINI